jgi:hypothetical protein
VRCKDGRAFEIRCKDLPSEPLSAPVRATSVGRFFRSGQAVVKDARKLDSSAGGTGEFEVELETAGGRGAVETGGPRTSILMPRYVCRANVLCCT